MADEKKLTRKDFFRSGMRTVLAAGIGGVGAASLMKSASRETVWQIDPELCTQCGNCATHCVLPESAVKCVHAYDVCGYCQLCGGYFPPDARILETGAENRLCPTDAIRRTFIEDPYFEYSIREELCIGCGKCVKGCTAFGNGSLYLQIRHDRCLNCNECRIARNCPSDAIRRIPADQAYILKGEQGGGEPENA